jgi:hypothetical protein
MISVREGAMPCLFAILAVSFPRVGLLLLWLFTPLVNAAFGGNWLWPLLGLIFLPFTTLMFSLVVGPLGPTNFWGWLMVILGLFVDVRGYFDAYGQRYRSPIPFPGIIRPGPSA